MARRAANEALQQAQLEADRFELILGASTGATREGIADSGAASDALGLAMRLAHDPIGALGHHLVQWFDGATRSTVVCSACSSGALAIAIGAMRLEQGAILPQVVGGTDSLNLLTLSGFEALGAMASAACRPFDEERSGLNLGEGAAFLVLETEAMARRRGAKVLVWLDSYCIGAEAHHLTHPEPDGNRASILIREALQRAGISPEQVGYVNAHGTATLANDAMECLALRSALGPAIDQVPVSSSKGQIGHTLAAAGAIEAVIAAQAIREQVLPPTAGLVRPANECALRHVPQIGVAADIQVALSTSFGFGGACAVLAFSHPERAFPGKLAPSTVAAAVVESVREPLDNAVWVSGLCTLGPDGIRRGQEVATWLSERRGDAPCDLPFEPLDLLVMERSRRFDRLTALTALGCSYALANAGLDSAPDSVTSVTSTDQRVGLVLGNALGPVGRSAQFVQRILSRGPKGANPAEFPHLLPSAVSGNASIYASLRGPVFNVSDLGATVQSALELGVNCLFAETATAMVVGTTECRDDWLLRVKEADHKNALACADTNDGSAWLVVEHLVAASKRGIRGCQLAAMGFASDTERLCASLRPAGPNSVVLWASASVAQMESLLAALGWSVAARRFFQPKRYDGWSHDGFVLAAGAAIVSNGEFSSCLVVTDPPQGRHCVVFQCVT